MAISRKDNYIIYERHIQNLQNAAASSSTSPSNRVEYVTFASEPEHPPPSSSSRHPSTSSSSRHPPPSPEAVINVEGDSVSSDGDSLFDQMPLNRNAINLNLSDSESDDNPQSCTLLHRHPAIPFANLRSPHDEINEPAPLPNSTSITPAVTDDVL